MANNITNWTVIGSLIISIVLVAVMAQARIVRLSQRESTQKNIKDKDKKKK